jgi:hypothetical protein
MPGPDLCLVSAGAVANGCTNGEYPNQPGGESQLSIACTLTTATGTSGNAIRIEDFPEAQWHTGAARVTAADGHITAGSTTITSVTAHFTASDINHAINVNIPSGITLFKFTDDANQTKVEAVTNSTTAVVSQAYPAGSTTTTAVFTIGNGTGRSAPGSTTSGSKTVTSSTANFNAADVGHTISATAIPHDATIATVTNATTMVMSVAATATASNANISIGDSPTLTTTRVIRDGHTTSASLTVTSASAAFAPSDLSLPVTGAGVPAGDYIAAVTNATTITLHAVATATSTAAVLTIGTPSHGAPLNGETVAQLSSKQSLNPALVGGVPPCSANVLTGTSLSGVWSNPGSFDPAASGASASTSIAGPMIGQIEIDTSVVAFAGYVSIVKAATARETQTAAHYDVTFPLLFNATAVCPAPSTAGVSSVFRFNATAVHQDTIRLGSVRGLKDFPAGTTTKTTSATVHVLNGTTSLFAATSSCTETYPGTSGFGCGLG